MKDTRIVSSPAAIAVRILPLLLVSKNFMPAKALPMPPVVVPHAALPGAMVSHRCHVLPCVVVNTMRRPVLPADAQHPYHSFHVKIVPSIVVIVSRLSGPPAVLTVMIPAAIAVVAVVMAVAVIAEIGAITAIIDGRKLIS